MSKGKVNPNKQPLTKMDMKLAEKKWKDQLEQMKVDAIADASLLVQSVIFLALCNAFDFYVEKLSILQAEVDRISEKIGDTDGKNKNYSIKTVVKELEKFGVAMKGEWI